MEQQMADINDSNDNNRHITIQALRRQTRTIISTLLNPKKVIPNEKGLPRDWQGLAELCEISGEKIPSLKENSDPSNKVLDLWIEKDKSESTVEKFITYLEELDRFDIIEDIETLIDEDIRFFKQNKNGFRFKNKPDLDADKYILTVDDVSRISEGLEPQTYDAFVLFADDDIDFAIELIETMEKQYNLKFCAKDRDLVGGGFEHDSVIKLISESFAQAIGIEQRQRKIIPCLYKACENLPPELACYFLLDYRRSGKLWNFWDKLYDSLRTAKHKTTTSENVNSINRSLSQYNSTSSRQQCLLKSVLHQENVNSTTLKPINQVKFNSMVDLNSIDNEKIRPDENMTSCNSANSLGVYPPKIKKNKSFYNRLKTMVKPKSTKNGEVKAEPPIANDIEIEKEKKKRFFSRGSKRKVALAN
ncbi:hypothetical protein NQ314_014455 [Rhamnusium bicolor]|uniref:Death domain-containing protein n=1 Tax=Rhamnusium bicolor TaxID=1586634 RepID=A0AAV8X1H5_9CUCU|nr:hypothetical protein NQ314_014455 [Rhamnusium bicolor]